MNRLKVLKRTIIGIFILGNITELKAQKEQLFTYSKVNYITSETDISIEPKSISVLGTDVAYKKVEYKYIKLKKDIFYYINRDSVVIAYRDSKQFHFKYSKNLELTFENEVPTRKDRRG